MIQPLLAALLAAAFLAFAVLHHGAPLQGYSLRVFFAVLRVFSTGFSSYLCASALFTVM